MPENRYLHIVRDEKFMDAAYSTLEDVAPGRHEYVTLDARAPFRYITRFQPVRWTIAQILDARFLSHLSEYSAVLIHNLTNRARVLVESSPPEVKFVWLGWGADYYHLIADQRQLLLPATRELFEQITAAGTVMSVLKKRDRRFFRAEWQDWIDQPIDWLRLQRKIRRFGQGRPEESRVLRSLRFFAPVLPDDYDKIIASVPSFSPRFVQWNYSVPLDPIDDAVSANPVILLGNSATFENNHLDAFELIRSAARDYTVICPLSYGRKDYGDEISRRGAEYFGASFRPLRRFIDHDEYTRLIRSCSIAVMNHTRQQAMGNVVLMLYYGKRVFLRPENPVFKFFRREGAIVFEIEQLPGELSRRPGPLREDEARLNREVVMSHFGPEAIRTKARDLLRTVGDSH